MFVWSARVSVLIHSVQKLAHYVYLVCFLQQKKKSRLKQYDRIKQLRNAAK